MTNGYATEEIEAQERELERKVQRDFELDDLKAILSTSSGIRYLRRIIMEEGKILTTTFTGNSAGFFNEGRRAFALQLLSEICEAAPAKVAEIIVMEGK